MHMNLQPFNDELSVKINGLLTPQLCRELIVRYENALGSEQSEFMINEI